MNIHYDFSGYSPFEISNDDLLRSEYIRDLLCRPIKRQSPGRVSGAEMRVLVQFWDDPMSIPSDVQTCMDSWVTLEESGFTRILFGDESARDFIREYFTDRYTAAFDECAHPAMRADYFRLCYILKLGGVYVDADDEYEGGDFESLIRDGDLRVQALCYDRELNSMVTPAAAFDSDQGPMRTFYVNNNPLVASAGHPVIADALECATNELLKQRHEDRDVQSITGPGNLTAALVRYAAALDRVDARHDFEILMNWEQTAVSKWPLSYRNDGRNWRHWVGGEDLPDSTEVSDYE